MCMTKTAMQRRQMCHDRRYRAHGSASLALRKQGVSSLGEKMPTRSSRK